MPSCATVNHNLVLSARRNGLTLIPSNEVITHATCLPTLDTLPPSPQGNVVHQCGYASFN